jgi:hypothetical protein
MILGLKLSTFLICLGVAFIAGFIVGKTDKKNK